MLRPHRSSTLFPYTTLFRSVLWLELPKPLRSRELFDAALAKGICFAPGDVFSAGGRYANCLRLDRKSTRLNSSHVEISYAVFCLKKKIYPASLAARECLAFL